MKQLWLFIPSFSFSFPGILFALLALVADSNHFSALTAKSQFQDIGKTHTLNFSYLSVVDLREIMLHYFFEILSVIVLPEIDDYRVTKNQPCPFHYNKTLTKMSFSQNFKFSCIYNFKLLKIKLQKHFFSSICGCFF